MNHQADVTDKRLLQLEEEQAYQEHTIGELDAVIYRQQQQLDRLERRCRELTGLVERLARQQGAGEGFDPEQERPPHY